MKILTALLLATSALALGEDMNTYYGQTPVPMDKRTKAPVNNAPDPFGSPLFVDGDTNIALDSRSMAAQEMENQRLAREAQKELDRSIRADIASGQPVTVLIAPEHFVQLTFLRDGEIVFPKRAFAGQPDLLIIDKKENSPYIYIAATAMVAGQTTNLFVETEEEGKIQTYVINLLVTEPQNIRQQVAVNLVDDRTPAIRGTEAANSLPDIAGTRQQGGTKTAKGAGGQNLPRQPITGRFNEEDVRRYMNTMIEMAEHFAEAKKIERDTGRVIYRDTDIKGYPAGQYNYQDPVEKTIWSVHQVWFYPRYDAILLDVRYNNPGDTVSMWDFAQMRWSANRSKTLFKSTAAAPLAMQTPPKRTNRIWFLLQGNRLDPRAEFAPVFPRAERRGTTRTGGMNAQRAGANKEKPTTQAGGQDTAWIK
jgi:hypothetical protein